MLHVVLLTHEKFVKRFIRKLLPRFCLDVFKQITNFSILAKDYGQFNTIMKWNSADGEGKPIPWYTYPAIEYLSHIDFSSAKIIEYGSGNSTLWWAQNCAHITSIEHDTKWYKNVKRRLQHADNVECFLRENEDAYVRQDYISDMDVVVIDGVHRSKCVDWLAKAVQEKPHTIMMLIFDNSDWYPNTIEKIRSNLGWVQMDFHGFSPINAYTLTTSIFINPAYAHKIKYHRPLMPIGGIIANAMHNADDA